MEQGAAAARAGAAAASSNAGAASKKVAESVPTPVASAVATAGNVASVAAAKVAAVTPASVAAAANKTAGAVQATASSLAAAVPGQSSQAGKYLTASLRPVLIWTLAAKGRESFEIDNTAMSATDSKHYNEWIANITVEKYAAKTTFFVYIFLVGTRFWDRGDLFNSDCRATSPLTPPNGERTPTLSELTSCSPTT
jgi:tyrosinase